ncbi:carbohydrate ABC transporter permease [Corynebacterium sp. CCM 9204]|uniref:carbohydrate ABC transporter permease n=1 Tax=Corynebacterium sp. CCM 9204 TaxID=3057616 RepID=UPI0035246BCD
MSTSASSGVPDSAALGPVGANPSRQGRTHRDDGAIGPVGKVFTYALLVFLTIVFLGPIVFIGMNSFKTKFSIATDPFSLPVKNMWVGLQNYATGLQLSGFYNAIIWSFFITVCSVVVIVFFCAMTAYYITRVKTWWTSALYYMFVFSMVVPFQMVMFPTVKIADTLGLDTPWGIIVLYLGFGAGLSIFMYSGFIKSIPLEVEEAAMIDGCNPLQIYYRVVMPMLKPTAITVSILNTMWIWNDYLLPYLVIGLSRPEYRTIPVVVQFLVGSNGNRDIGALMAMLVLAIIPIIIFYVAAQKYIIEGVAAGAVKG